MLLPKRAKTNTPSAERFVLTAVPPPADATTRRVPKTAAPAASLLLGSWPLSLLANLSSLALGSTPPFETSSSPVPMVAPCPLLVGALGGLVSGRPSLAQSAGLFGPRPVFQRPLLGTSSSLLLYESSLLTVSTPAPPPPLVDACTLMRSRQKRDDASLLHPFLRGPYPRSPACDPCCRVARRLQHCRSTNCCRQWP
jgi:hypothetical protein